ncbi:MAG: hypothetical protein ACE5R4_02625 [Armatimonadota bacterium]
MIGWLMLWHMVLLAALVLFGLMVVVAGSLGILDLKSLFQRLREEHGEEGSPRGP